ncbi:MAG TPA: hypothetical protein VG318_04670 [Actinomycetota bacterium]|nr:hypothetical protein [Actinomycetota bacterium]
MAAQGASRSRRRSGIALVGAALIASVVPTIPAAGQEPAVDRVVVRTHDPVHTRLRVEFPVELSTVAPGADIRLRSEARRSGFAIVDASSKKLAFAGFRNEPCMEPECDGWVFYYHRNGMLTESGTGHLEPGTYDLHVIADGDWTELSLTALGVELVDPERRAPSEVRELNVRELVSTNEHYVAEKVLQLDSPVLVLATTWTKIRPFEAVDIGVCLYRGVVAAPLLAYHSGCNLLGAKKYSMFVRTSASPLRSHAHMSVPVLLRLGKGRWGIGAYSEIIGVRRTVGSSVFLLEL